MKFPMFQIPLEIVMKRTKQNIEKTKKLIPRATLYFVEYSRCLQSGFERMAIVSIARVEAIYRYISIAYQKLNAKVMNVNSFPLINFPILHFAHIVIVIILIPSKTIKIAATYKMNIMQ